MNEIWRDLSQGDEYKFSQVQPGMRKCKKLGFNDGIDTQGTPGGGTSIDDAFQNIPIVSGTTGANNNFGELPTTSIAGTVYRDLGNDGLYEPGHLEKLRSEERS